MSGTRPALGAVVVGMGVVVVLVLLAGGILTLGVGGGHDADAPETATTRQPITASSAAEVTGEGDGGPAPVGTVATDDPSPPATPAAGDEQAGRLGPPLVVAAHARDEFATGIPAAGGLADGMVVALTVTGFPPDTDGRARQCQTIAGRRACTGTIPLRFDDEGVARTLFLLGERVDGLTGCRPDDPPCTLVVDGSSAVAQLGLVFGAEVAAPATVQVSPRAGLAAGDVVAVAVSGAPEGSQLAAAWCVPPGLDDDDCVVGGPGVVAAAAGASVRLSLAVDGSGEATCRRARCGVGVLDETGRLLAPVVEVRFASGPGVSYDAARLAVGLTLAAAFALAALWTGRATDWTRPDEAVTARVE